MSGHGRIPDSFIEAVLAKTDIVSVIQENIKLKKNGANYSACCPFHHEKTPSFTVSATKQFYHCFGCSAHGDAIRFLMEYQSLSFVEAVERLATRLGMSVPKDPVDEAKAKIRNAHTVILNRVAEFYSAQFKDPRAQAAVTYLKKRGLTGQTAKDFAMGFAKEGWDHLIKHFEGEPEALKILEEAGLIIKHQSGRFYDRFRNRIMFPIRDRKGNVLGFGGRVMDKSEPKYLNSPESPLFQKGHCLYGIYEALKGEKWQKAIVVEGYFDVVMLAQYQIKGAVATLGTAITSHHLSYLFQQVSDVVFCFDGDKAGQAAAWKALQLVLPFLTKDRHVRFAFLPQGEDPDSFVRNNGTAHFKTLLANSTPLSEYLFATLCKEVKPDSVDNRAHLANMAQPLLEQIPAGIYKEMMYEQLAQLVSTSLQVVRGEKAARMSYDKRSFKKPMKSTAPKQLLSTAFFVCGILLRDPSLVDIVKNQGTFFETLSTPGMDMLRVVVELLNQGQNTLSPLQLKEGLKARGFSEQRINECESKVALVPVDGLNAELAGAIHRLLAIGQQEITEKLLQKAKEIGLTEQEKQQLKEILQFRESID
ncbi:MAG: DNA primase [Candidatus Berkiella sp.]